MDREHFSVRLPSRLLDEIRSIAEARERPASYVVTSLIDEGLRVRRCPGVFFADAPSGRRAGIVGSRLAVWEIIQVWTGLNRDRAALAGHLPHLAPWQIDAALRYYRFHPEEIDRAIQDNVRMADEMEAGGGPGLGHPR